MDGEIAQRHARALADHARSFVTEQAPPIDGADLAGSMDRSHQWYCEHWGGARWLLGEMATTIDALVARVAELEDSAEPDTDCP